MRNIAKSFLIDAWMAIRGGRGNFKELREKTAMVLENEIPRDVCAVLIKQIDELAEDKSSDQVWRDEQGSDTRILGFETIMPEIMQYLRLKDRIQAIDDYLGTKTNSWFLMANRVLPQPGNLGSGGGLHRDSAFSHQVKCIWYLSDVASENGPFQYVPGSNTSAFADRQKYPLGESRFAAAKDPMVEVIANAGALLVADTKCIHAGKPIETGARYALTLYTYKSQDKSREVFTTLGLNPDYVGQVTLR